MRVAVLCDIHGSAECARRIRETEYPQAHEFAAQYVLQTPSEADMLEQFTSVSFR